MNTIAVFILAAVLGIKNRAVFREGLNDGFELGENFSLRQSNQNDQWAYDTGVRVGACLRVRFKQATA